ncbi:MAG: GLPGLI family protein [Prevotellaceae bacterium]|jgi:GLPGLI family protein|nr:GLPGLI family protein [Prevotellaceae bacterium]
MKKTIISLITILIICTDIQSQFIVSPSKPNINNMTVIDSSNLRIWYAFNATDIRKQETYDDLQRLEIGNQTSKYYSYFLFNDDSLSTVWIKNHPNAKGIPNKFGTIGKKDTWDEYIFSEYFKNYAEHSLTQYTRMPFGMRNFYQYSEKMPEQIWKIAEDTLTIAEYLCQKATCRFRGRNYTAWFAIDIPIQNGPWKFGSLPGLILKVSDNDMLYKFECVKVELFNKKYPIKIHDYRKFEKTDRKKLDKLFKNLYNDYFNAVGLIFTDTDNSTMWKKIPYNPLELE